MFIAIPNRRTDNQPSKFETSFAFTRTESPRQFWNIGVVKSLITGRDGFYGGAVVRTRGGDRVEVTRPLKKLYPVEAGLRVIERQNRNTDIISYNFNPC